MYQTIFFDIDGTLLDTRQPMADAYGYAVASVDDIAAILLEGA